MTTPNHRNPVFARAYGGWSEVAAPHLRRYPLSWLVGGAAVVLLSLALNAVGLRYANSALLLPSLGQGIRLGSAIFALLYFFAVSAAILALFFRSAWLDRKVEWALNEYAKRSAPAVWLLLGVGLVGALGYILTRSPGAAGIALLSVYGVLLLGLGGFVLCLVQCLRGETWPPPFRIALLLAWTTIGVLLIIGALN